MLPTADDGDTYHGYSLECYPGGVKGWKPEPMWGAAPEQGGALLVRHEVKLPGDWELPKDLSWGPATVYLEPGFSVRHRGACWRERNITPQFFAGFIWPWS